MFGVESHFFEGFRLVLIQLVIAINQLPTLQMNLDPFDLNVSDWFSRARVSCLPR